MTMAATVRKAALALALAGLGTPTVAAWAHTDVVRWPHEGRIWYGGGDTSEMIMLWHNQPRPAFRTYDKFVELDIQVPKGFVSGCTAWTDLPDPYDDCSTGGFLDGGTHDSYGVGSYRTDLLQANRWYTARFTYRRTSQTNTGTVRANAAWQETYISVSLCPQYPSRSPHCLLGYEGGRIHQGTSWRQGTVSKSSWVTPAGTTAPRDFSCDYWHDPGCTS
jgi:hypothetical protein